MLSVKSRILKVFIFAALVGTSLDGVAKNPDSLRHAIGIQPLQLIFKEVVVNYKFPVSKSIDLQSTLAYRFKNEGATNVGEGHGNVPDMPNQLMFNPYAQAIRIGIAPTIHIKENGTFFMIDLFYRYWWMHKERFVYQSGEDVTPAASPALHSVNAHVFSLRLLAGGTVTQFRLNSHNWFRIRFFTGIGLRYKQYTTVSHSLPESSNQTSFSSSDSRFRPSYHVGFSTEIAWK